MRHIFILLACILTLGTAAAEDYYGTILLHSGTELLPNVAVPTPGEVAGAKSAATAAKSSATDAAAQVQALATVADTLTTQTAALNGSAIVYGSCVSFGSVSIEANTNATAVILAMNLTSNVVDTLYIDIYVRFDTPLAALPAVEHSIVLPTAAAGTWTEQATLAGGLTTLPVNGIDIECYRLTVGLSAANPSGFFRIRGEAQETVIGQFLVLEGLSVNGVTGLSVTIPGLGVFKQGLLVELVEGGE